MLSKTMRGRLKEGEALTGEDIPKQKIWQKFYEESLISGIVRSWSPLWDQ